MRPLNIGFSPCPNDTFIFYALMHGRVAADGLQFSPAILADVETLNEWALARRLDVTKLSFHALGHVLDDYVLLKAGTALGRGCGPLLVAASQIDPVDLETKTVAIPGRFTTASLLLQLYAARCPRLVSMRFDQIMPSITAGRVDAGVIIHESRFTYPQHGLMLLQDLGAWWEEISGLPIPLGGIAAKRSLGEKTLLALERGIRESVRWAFTHPERCQSYIREHAQELDSDVINNHIDLYVNPFSEDLGQEGLAAVEEFLDRGRRAGILPGAAECSIT